MKALRFLLLAFFVVGALFYVNTLIPAPQPAKAVSQIYHGSVDSCGVIKVESYTETACTSGSYSASVRLVSLTGRTYTVNPLFQNFFCTGNGDLGGDGNSSSCLKNQEANTAPVQVGPGGTVISAPTLTASKYGFTNACGTYQTDFSFTIQGTSCYFGTDATRANNTNQVWAYSACNTNTQCLTPTPVPPTPTPTQPVTPPHLIVKKHVDNNGGGTKSANDFTIFVKDANSGVILDQFFGSETGTTITLPPTTLYTVYEGIPHTDYDLTFSGQCSGMVADGHTATCTLINTFNQPVSTPTPTPVAPTPTPTEIITCFNKDNQLIQVGINDIALCQTVTQINNQNVTIDNSGNNNNTNTNNNQQQQQQSEAVLAASVQPAVSTTQLPSTGSGTDVLFTLLGLLPVGFKLRKLV